MRPWLYAGELLDRFERYTSAESLAKRLKQCYPYIGTLEQIAIKRGIAIHEPFQGTAIGAFTVMAPSRLRYLDLIVASEKTPESTEESSSGVLSALLKEAAAKVSAFVKAAWGHEVFSPNETSVENEMSVVQYATLCGKRILLTGDAGRAALIEAAHFASYMGLTLPGIDRFQVPHHGSRRNVSTEVLDAWLGPRLPAKLESGQETFTALISSAKADTDHPRKSVVRAFIHRGAKVISTEGKTVCTSQNAPDRGWVAAEAIPYPEEQEQG
jgi:hypothetical protein